MKKKQKNIFKNSVLVISAIIFILFPSVSFAQLDAGVQSQLAPSYGPTGLPIGMQSQVSTIDSGQGSGSVTGSQAQIAPGEGQGISIGNTSSLTTQNGVGGTVVGTSAQYSSSISSGLSCTLPVRPTFKTLIIYATCVLSKSIIPLILGFAMVLFIWGVVQYVIATDDEAKKKKGKTFMIWGIISLAVMTSVWGLSRILSDTFGANEGWVIPQLNTGKNSDNTIPATPQVAPEGGSFIDVINTNDDNSFNLPAA